VELKNWPHPADAATINEAKDYEDQTITVYTDGSKSENGVGSGVAIFIGKELVTQLKYKLDNRCSNNQAEQLAIVKVLEAIEMIAIKENSPRIAAILTDSRITLDSIKNVKNHSYLVEEIRKRLLKLERSDWTIAFSWVKAHAGIHGNELADQLAKVAVRTRDKTISCNRIPLSTLSRELEEETKQQWQKNWKKLQRQL
jgi:ribonuclease HI